MNLIKNDDNYKNILQVKIQKEFKVTPDYLEIDVHDADVGYKMGVYLCLGQAIHNVKHHDAIPINQFRNYEDIHQFMCERVKFLCFWEKEFIKLRKRRNK